MFVKMDDGGGKRIASKIDGQSEISESSTAASRFMSAISDDLLLEIFIRLPDFRCIIACNAVCKRWVSLIPPPQFICNFTRRHKLRQFISSASFWLVALIIKLYQ